MTGRWLVYFVFIKCNTTCNITIFIFKQRIKNCKSIFLPNLKNEEMKMIHFVLFLLSFCLTQNSFGQRSIKTTVAQSFRSCNFDKLDIYSNQQIIELVLFHDTPAEVDSMLQIICEEEANDDYSYAPSLIKALGFIAQPTDTHIIEVLAEQAKGSMFLRAYAIEALFRIGGKPMERILEYILSSDDFNFQLKSLRNTWLIDRREDLLTIGTVITRHLQNNPNQQINKYLNRHYLILFDGAFMVSERENIPFLQEKLKRIIAYQEPYFNSVSGTSTPVWATKRLVDITPVEERAALIEDLKDYQYYRNIERTPKDFVSFQLFRLGNSLSELDRAYLAPLSTATTANNVGGFAVFQDREELADYYRFRAYLIQ